MVLGLGVGGWVAKKPPVFFGGDGVPMGSRWGARDCAGVAIEASSADAARSSGGGRGAERTAGLP